MTLDEGHSPGCCYCPSRKLDSQPQRRVLDCLYLCPFVWALLTSPLVCCQQREIRVGGVGEVVQTGFHCLPNLVIQRLSHPVFMPSGLVLVLD